MTSKLKDTVVAGLWLLLATVGVLSADVVHLQNGRTMEGIVLEETAEQVMIRLAFGEIGLPRSSISRIERGESALAEYMKRRAELVNTNAPAAEWLLLARWADENGLDHSGRKASLMAARLDPGLVGLAPLMHKHGYAFDDELAVWLPHDEMMRQRGYVLSGNRWLSPAEAMQERRAEDVRERERMEQERQDRLTRAMEMMALARIAEAEENRRRLEEASTYPVGLPLYGGYPVIVPPVHGPWPPHRPRPPHAKPHDRPGVEHPSPGHGDPNSATEINHGGLQKASDSSNQP